MRKFVFAAILATLAVTAAQAQSDPNMTCADYLKALAQMGGTQKTGDATTDAMNKKMDDYCKANPAAKVSEAMDKAMQ